MRVVIGIGDGDIQPVIAFFFELADQLQRFGQIGFFIVFLIDAPAVRIGNGVVDVQPRGDLQVGKRFADFIHRFQSASARGFRTARRSGCSRACAMRTTRSSGSGGSF